MGLHSWSVISDEFVGKVLSEDLYTIGNVLLLPKGTCLTKEHVSILKRHKIIPRVELKAVGGLDPQTPTNVEQIGSKKFNRKYKEAIEHSKKIFHNLNCFSEQTADQLFDPFIPLIEQVFEEEEAVLYMQNIKNYDEYTYRHSLNVGLIASLIAKSLELPYVETVLIGKMGFLHDIGKMRVNEEILNKPGRLTDEEFKEIKKHTIYGYELLKQAKSINPNILAGVLYHHERLDGTGYPTHLKEDKIPYYVQILSVADIYDAISSNRVYQKGRSLFETIKLLMREASEHRLNKKIVLAFVKFLMEKNIGKEVLLNNGDVGHIIFVPVEEPHKPIVMVDDKPIDLRKVVGVEIVNTIEKKHPA